MASPNLYPNGAGGTTGHSLATRSPVWALNGGFIWYVHHTGTDAASPAGRRREAPLATLAQAHTNASAGDIIVLLPGHTQSLSAAQTFNKAQLTLVSEGTGSSRARFTCSGTVAMFDVTAAGVRFGNLYFPASTAVPTARIRTAAARTVIEDCYFECGTSDTAEAVAYVTGAGTATVRGTSFVATAATPAIGIEVVNAMTGLELEDVTFDGGSYGWTDYAFKATAAVTGMYGNRVHQLNHSDVFFATGSSGKWVVGTPSGAALFVQDA
jgi:hypothetical protein